MGKQFYNQRDEKNIEKIREICADLPPYVQEFFLGIQMRTSTLTRLNYAYDLRIFFDFLLHVKFKRYQNISEISLADLDTLTAFDIEIYLDYLSSYQFHGKKFQCGEKAKMRKLASLRTFFKYFFKKDLLSANVVAKVDLPKIHEQSIIRLEPNEVTQLLDTAEYGAESFSPRQERARQRLSVRDVAILTLFLGTGIRISELVGLDQKDIDFATNAFTITRKGGNQSILYFSDEVADALRDYMHWVAQQRADQTDFSRKISDPNALFLSSQGNRISIRAVEKLVKKYSAIASPLKKITPHKLRSTYGTELYRETQDIYVVADVLGHKDVNTTKKHYAAISDEIRRNASRKVILREHDPDD